MGDFDFKHSNFTIKGFKDLYKLIDHLPETVKKQELEPLLVTALEPMAAFAQVMAPNDPLTSAPYDLPSSIVVSTRQRTGRSKRDRALGKYDARAYMGPNKYGYPQAMFAEFGTTQRVWKEPGPVKATGFMPAQPYMRPAYDSEKGTALRIITDGFGKRLQLILDKYGSKG
jgi:hypothetical protein